MTPKKLLICSFLLVSNLLFGNENLALGKKVYYSIYRSNFNKDAPSRLTMNTVFWRAEYFGQFWANGRWKPVYVCVDLGEKTAAIGELCLC